MTPRWYGLMEYKQVFCPICRTEDVWLQGEIDAFRGAETHDRQQHVLVGCHRCEVVFGHYWIPRLRVSYMVQQFVDGPYLVAGRSGNVDLLVPHGACGGWAKHTQKDRVPMLKGEGGLWTCTCGKYLSTEPPDPRPPAKLTVYDMLG